MVNISQRIDKLREKLAEKNVSAILVSNQANRFYLTGWSGDSESGYLLITLKKAFVITDSRYTEEAIKKTIGFEMREYGQNDDFWRQLFREIRVAEVAFEANDLTVAQLKKLKKLSKVKFTPTQDLVETLRAVKDSEEVRLIKKAASIADRSFEYILSNIRVGTKEKEIAWELEKFMRAVGASKNAWDHFIVASGPNSSMVHYAAGERKVRKGDLLLLDWGCYYQGYCCDISRVIFLGTPTEKQVKVYNLVLAAQELALNYFKVGTKTQKADFAARDFLKQTSAYYFKHSLGHGVGLEVHELPRINEKAKDKFAAGNVVTVEPGIYIPGWGGVRVEDMVLVTNEKPILLTKAPKKLAEVVVK